MFLTLSNFFDEEIAPVVIDDSQIDVSEFLGHDAVSFPELNPAPFGASLLGFPEVPSRVQSQ